MIMEKKEYIAPLIIVGIMEPQDSFLAGGSREDFGWGSDNDAKQNDIAWDDYSSDGGDLWGDEDGGEF